MKVLVTGACGLLGAHLMTALSRRHEVIGIDRHPWWGDHPMTVLVQDMTAAGCLQETMVSATPEIVIHCAGMVDVDACERDPCQAYALNTQLTRALVQAVPADCVVVYISTDGMFRGDKASATEEEITSPRTVYARSKLQGEWEVKQGTANHLIVRTNFYGWSSGRKDTAAEWLYHALAQGRSITLFEDFFFSPIYVVDFVERLIRLIEGDSRGLVHLAGGERVSKYRFGTLMGQAAGFSMARVRRGSLAEAQLAAPRPKDMSLDSSRFCRMTGMSLPGCAEGLRRFLGDRARPLSARVGVPQESASIEISLRK